MAKSMKNLFFGFCLVALTVVMFIGCGAPLSTFKDNPASTDIVTGNGTLAVTKGDYLYFVNGYVGYSDVGDTNHDGKITYPALYRIKLTDGHPVEVPKKYDEEGKEIFDGSHALENVDVLARKVVGFEYMGLYICGDYLYYASPYNGKDKELEVESSRVDFFRIKLDRSSGSEWVYTTDSKGDSVKYSAFVSDGNTYFSVLDGSKLVAIRYDKNNAKTLTVVSENATSVAFAKISASNENISNFQKNIYYTRDRKDEDGSAYTNGNVLCKFDLTAWKNSDKVFFDDDSTITLKLISSDKIYYERKSATSNITAFYAVRTESDVAGLNEIRISNTNSEYYLIPDNNDIVIVKDSSNNITLINHNGNSTQLYNGSASIVKIEGDYVYFTDNSNNNIKRIKFTEEGAEAETLTTSDMTVKTGQSNFVCVNNQKIYFFKSYSSGNYYLHMIDLTTTDEETGTYYNHFIGVLQETDYDTEETEE